MAYYKDLSIISIDEYQSILEKADLIPSRRILQKDIPEIFNRIKNQNIQSLEALKQTLKTKVKLKEFSEASGISEDYLTVLIREINSYHPKPNKLADFICISEETVGCLEKLKIKTTLHLYPFILDPKSRNELSVKTGIHITTILKLAQLTDLSRIRWVNHTFAYVLLEAGYETAKDVANSEYKKLYDDVKTLNAERKIFKGNIGLHDMNLCIEAAKEIPHEIIFDD